MDLFHKLVKDNEELNIKHNSEKRCSAEKKGESCGRINLGNKLEHIR